MELSHKKNWFFHAGAVHLDHKATDAGRSRSENVDVKSLEEESARLLAKLRNQEERADRLEHLAKELFLQHKKDNDYMLIQRYTKNVEDNFIQFLWPGVRNLVCLKSLDSCFDFLAWVRSQPKPPAPCRAPVANFGFDEAWKEFFGLTEEARDGIIGRLNTLLSNQKFKRFLGAIARVKNELKDIVTFRVAQTVEEAESFVKRDGAEFIRTHRPDLAGPMQVIREYQDEHPPCHARLIWVRQNAQQTQWQASYSLPHAHFCYFFVFIFVVIFISLFPLCQCPAVYSKPGDRQLEFSR